MVITNKARKQKRVARWIASLALLLLYGFGSTQSGYLHQLVHPEEIASIHAPAREEDPCHRSMFHGVGEGCQHEFHVAKISNCGMFHALAHSDIQFCIAQPSADRAGGVKLVTHFHQDRPGPVLDAVYLRGPPMPSGLHLPDNSSFI